MGDTVCAQFDYESDSIFVWIRTYLHRIYTCVKFASLSLSLSLSLSEEEEEEEGKFIQEEEQDATALRLR